LGNEYRAITECNDGTICENAAPCMPHPTKEGTFMCDCNLALDGNKNSLVKFAGVYCEHQATSYCQSGSEYSEHAFCTNGGRCEGMVSMREEHAGCKCPTGYEGDFCQFVRGGRPSDWQLSNYMHPSLVTVYGSSQDYQPIVIMALIIGVLTTFLCICAFAVLYVYLPSLKNRMDERRNQKERDTGGGDRASGEAESSLGGRRTSAAGPSSISFVGGRSVYRKKNSTTSFVTTDTMDADGGVLTEVLGGRVAQATMEATEEDVQGLEDLDINKSVSLEEVNLDDEPASKLGEMA